MQLVILAAGHGRRFGGLKQLAPVGPNGEAIMDYTASAAQACGFDGVVVVVREEIHDEILDHIRAAWPATFPVAMVCQPPVPGTAQAVLAARPAIDGPFGVANADDLYGAAALGALLGHFSSPTAALAASGLDPLAPSRHVLVAYRLIRTVLTAGGVTRGLCDVGGDGRLLRIVEHTVDLRDDGGFDAAPLARHRARDARAERATRTLSGSERVSMNLWGFHPRMLDHLTDAVGRFDPEAAPRPELLLPDVVGALLETDADSVHVVDTPARCIGVTHREDLAIVRDELALDAADHAPLPSARER